MWEFNELFILFQEDNFGTSAAKFQSNFSFLQQKSYEQVFYIANTCLRLVLILSDLQMKQEVLSKAEKYSLFSAEWSYLQNSIFLLKAMAM